MTCTGTHHKGCACHEAAWDAQLAELRAQLAAAREAVAGWPEYEHDKYCYGGHNCVCSADANNARRRAARLALGLEEK